MSKLPPNDEPVLVDIMARYKRYKPDGAKQMGRWQVHNGYGWENTDMEIDDWRPCDNQKTEGNKPSKVVVSRIREILNSQQRMMEMFMFQQKLISSLLDEEIYKQNGGEDA